MKKINVRKAEYLVTIGKKHDDFVKYLEENEIKVDEWGYDDLYNYFESIGYDPVDE